MYIIHKYITASPRKRKILMGKKWRLLAYPQGQIFWESYFCAMIPAEPTHSASGLETPQQNADADSFGLASYLVLRAGWSFLFKGRGGDGDVQGKSLKAIAERRITWSAPFKGTG